MRRRLLTLLAACALAVGVAACGTDQPAGGGFRLRASQLTATTSTVAPKPSFTTEVATAVVPVVQVFAAKPGTATPASAPQLARPGPDGVVHPPIPREDLVSANVRKTDFGWEYDNPTYFGNPLVLLVTANEGEWLKVLLPARPNGLEGWIRASDVTLSEHRFHAELVLSERIFRVFEGEEQIAETRVVIGKDATPTPTGRFYFTEKVQQSNPGGAYGPWVLATNGYSEAMDFFDGGLPVIAFHGTNQPGLIGQAASNGCVRMPNEVITMLAATLPAGTPVEIRA
jgi:lipoprotein-anchoring transpeptidase ErfK/SrfK